MKNFVDMSMGEKLEEVERRAQRRREGKPLAPDPEELERIAAEEDARLEKEIQAEVRDIYLANGCTVYNLSQPRASKQTPGIGDLYVLHRRLEMIWWHETKTPTGKQRPDQHDFEVFHAPMAHKVGYVLGGVAAAENYLLKIGASERTASGGLEPKRWRS